MYKASQKSEKVINRRALAKIGIAIACVACILMMLFIFLSSQWGFVWYIEIQKMQIPPACYFNLTEEDFDRYPVLREMLNEMEEKNKTSVHRELNWKEGEEIYKYMCRRIDQETGGGCGGIFFMYKGCCYRVRFAAT